VYFSAPLLNPLFEVTSLLHTEEGNYSLLLPLQLVPFTDLLVNPLGEVTSLLHTEGGSNSLLLPLVSLAAVASFILILGAVRTFYRETFFTNPTTRFKPYFLYSLV